MTASFTFLVRRAAGAFVLAAALTSSAAAQTTVLSTPVGVITDSIRHGSSGLALPLIGEDLVVGVATGNTAGAIAFGAAAGDLGERLAADRRYYVEIATGPLEGERLDLDTAATRAAAGPSLVLDLGEDTFSTLAMLPADALAGARCIVRPHVTLADLPAMFSPALSGSRRHRHWADSVSLLGTRGFETYTLAEDDASWYSEDERVGGEWGRRHRAWCERRKHKRPPTDFRDMVIPPDVSIVVSVNGQARTWTHEGLVRTNAFRKNLVRGPQAFASGYPVDLSPAQIGAFVDATQPARERWTGSNTFPFADQIEVLFSGRKPLDLYFLRGDGHTWQALTRSWREDFANQPILGDTDMILIRRKNPDPAFIIPVPFEPVP
ncbi:MAG: hypothetical protein IAE82_06110 [Opitutaceae bacterium]|nr:hypothetical protein [Opitutaceae bacterium]